MKTQILRILILFFTCLSYSQDYSFLESKNGFRNIKIGASVTNYPEFKAKDNTNIDSFKWNIDTKANFVYVGTEKDKIKTAKIIYIYLTTENTIISEIRVVTEKVLNVYYILKSAYGNPTKEYNSRWIWQTDNIECSIEGDGSQIPGYHIIYKEISKARKELNELKAKSEKEAQAEL